MMNSTLSPQDFENLSAYLDGELAPADKQRLEARLQTDAELKQVLQEIRRTRQVIRSLPVMRAPRNFTLTPEMAGISPRRENQFVRWFSTLRLSSALAAILLIFVLLGDFLTGVTPVPLLSQPQALQMTDAAQSEALEELAPLQEAPATIQGEALESEALPSEGEALRADQEAPSAGLESPSEEPAAEEEFASEIQATPMPVPPRAPIGGVGGGGGGDGGAPPPAEPLLQPDQLRLLVRSLELFLAATAILLGISAWIIYRRKL